MSAKYCRSFHLPNSPGATSDDKRMDDTSGLIGVEVVITEKLDGSNLCFTRDSVFARSHSGPPPHPSFNEAKRLQPKIGPLIDPNLSAFGEWCAAVHSIRYTSLPHYFNMFGLRDDESDMWWAWDDVTLQAAMLDLPTVPVLFRGTVRSNRELLELAVELSRQSSVYGPEREGVVVRVTRAFGSEEFSRLLGKWVRPNHVAGEHWSKGSWERQGLADPTTG
jgi:hypothetical protein